MTCDNAAQVTIYSCRNSLTFTVFLIQVSVVTELGDRGITANSVAPKAVQTDFGGGVATLLSDDNRWVNAQRIEVTGGQQL